MGKRVICLGGRGDPASIGKAIVDANQRGRDELEFSGFLNDEIEIGELFEGFPVLGKLEDARKLVDKGYYFINAILRIDGNERRIKMIEDLEIPVDRWTTFIHPTAYVAPDVKFGPGCVVMPNVCISPEVVFNKCCILLQACTVGHNTFIDEFTHISAQACLGAGLQIGKGVHVGMNSSVAENVKMGDYSTLGMHSLGIEDIGKKEIWAGVPARFLRMARDE